MDKQRWTQGERLAQAGLALAFLTRLPLRIGVTAPGALARAAWAFPLAGLVVGTVGAIVFALSDRLELPFLATALLTVAATALLTGALHEDGLADTADGLGGADRAAALAIMRDSRIGTYGVLALIASVGLRVAALAALREPHLAVGALLAAHTVSRGFLPAVMLWCDPAREDGLGAQAGRPTPAVAAAAAIIAVLVAVLTLGITRGIGAVGWAAVAATCVALLARRRLGGYTGDVLGAVQQIGEIVMLLVAAV